MDSAGFALDLIGQLERVSDQAVFFKNQIKYLVAHVNVVEETLEKQRTQTSAQNRVTLTRLNQTLLHALRLLEACLPPKTGAEGTGANTGTSTSTSTSTSSSSTNTSAGGGGQAASLDRVLAMGISEDWLVPLVQQIHHFGEELQTPRQTLDSLETARLRLADLRHLDEQLRQQPPSTSREESAQALRMWIRYLTDETNAAAAAAGGGGAGGGVGGGGGGGGGVWQDSGADSGAFGLGQRLRSADVRLEERVEAGGAGRAGTAGRAEVWRGVWQGKAVTVRRIPIHALYDPGQDVEDAVHEGQQLQRLVHPNLVQLYGVCIVETALAVVMEFAAGETLRAMITRQTIIKGLPLLDALRCGLDISKGLAYMYAQRPPVPHRNLSATNILVVNNVCKITDVGLHKLKDSLARTARTNEPHAAVQVQGSNSNSNSDGDYHGPEVEDRRGHVGEKSDVFSVLALLWEMLSGVPPSKANRAPPARCPVAVQEMIKKGMSDNPKHRPHLRDVEALLTAEQPVFRSIKDYLSHNKEMTRRVNPDALPALRPQELRALLFYMSISDRTTALLLRNRVTGKDFLSWDLSNPAAPPAGLADLTPFDIRALGRARDALLRNTPARPSLTAPTLAQS